MRNRLSFLGGLAVLAFSSLLFLPSNAAAPLPEDHDTFWEYRVIGDRILLKNPNASVALVPSVCKGHCGLSTTWWGDDVRLTYAPSSHSRLQRVVVENSYLHVVWVDTRINGEMKAFYKRSKDLGYRWEDDVMISVSPDLVEDGAPDITLGTSCLHAVWQNTWKPIGEQGHIYYRRTLDHGATWEEVYFLSSYEHQSKPSIAALQDTIYVIFTRYIDTRDIYEIHFRKSYDEGATWTEDRVITDYGPSLIRGTLRANERGLHYVFNHKDNFDEPGNLHRSQEVFYIHSPDWGNTWTEPAIVSHRDSIHSQWPSMCVDDEGRIHVTWFDYKTSPYSETADIFYTNSTDNGQTWAEIQVLTDAHTARWSNLIARGDSLYLVWEDWRHGYDQGEIYFKHSPDRGQSWDREERLTHAPNESLEPVIVEQDDTLYVAWSDARDDPSNIHAEVYFKRGYLTTTSVPESSVKEHTLYLNSYPNPSNVSTVIAYQLRAGGHVTLEVYNLLGRKVATLVDETQEAGYRSVIWDASEVSSGLYFYKLTAGEFTETRRMMLVK